METTINEFPFSHLCKQLAGVLFNVDTFSCFRSGNFILNVGIPKDKMDLLYQIIHDNLHKVLLDKKYTTRGEDVLKVPLRQLLGKLIIIFQGPISNTRLDEVGHLRIGDKVKRVYFNELHTFTHNELIDYNKHHLTIVIPPNGFRSINYNPEKAWEHGCQIVTALSENGCFYGRIYK